MKIPSQAVNDFVVDLKNEANSGDIWVGLQDLSDETSVIDPPGDWYWISDGSEDTFTAWSGNEPNDSGNEDCTEVRNNGLWNDVGCGQNQTFVCEFPL